MKHITCSIALLCLLHQAAQAEEPQASLAADSSTRASSPGRIAFGLSAGANFASMRGTERTPAPFDPYGLGIEARQEVSDKLALGGYVGLRMSARWSALLEVWWSMKGSEGNLVVPLPDGILTGPLDHQLHYLHIPVLIRRDIEYVDGVTPYVAAGGYASVLLSSDVGGTAMLLDSTSMQMQGTYEVSGELGDATRNLDIGAVAGAGIRFALGPGALVLSAYYEYSLLTAIDGSFMVELGELGGAWIDATDMRHHGMSLRVGYEL